MLVPAAAAVCSVVKCRPELAAFVESDSESRHAFPITGMTQAVVAELSLAALHAAALNVAVIAKTGVDCGGRRTGSVGVLLVSGALHGGLQDESGRRHSGWNQ
jgi:hypothetical protein